MGLRVCVIGCVYVRRRVCNQTPGELSCLFVRDEPEQVPLNQTPGEEPGQLQTSTPWACL